ncbi:sugar ABC transporter ATP-binding protein [Alkaliphilus serpentinus]|uniref:Sugar ABC transporter ATP-binding protein n=2 Tax=Alkaliphilus serpentinus TaxID=1482731 RepID=A0A833HP83_9FIRM|nr:sugar ABC transporter ATP-binding protein [Alkaliphilus serpentinus]KAB3530466.1 sugar ABC transporter ATP-binding protein [Alkaliphilus serpentinus]
MNNISKEYYGTRVLNNINLEIKAGEIHALLGENGAGKSTLMNILFGMSVIHSTGGFQGEIELEGNKVDIHSPLQAMNLGIGMVHQEFMLIPGYTITENIKLNRELIKKDFMNRLMPAPLKQIDFDEMNKEARKALDTLDIGIEEWVKVAGLPVGYMQFIEIAREIDKQNIKVLVFDEPTAVLTESEAENLLKAMKKIASTGIAIIFITHRLDEVMEVADNITILRDGQFITRKNKADTNVFEMAELMVGRQIESMVQHDVKDYDNQPVSISLKGFNVAMPGEEVRNLNLDIYQGEILGIGGLAGQGKIGIANGIMGLYPAWGEVLINGQPLTLNNPKESIKRNLAFVSEDRRGVGLLLDTSIEMNIAITAMQNKDKFIKKYGLFSQKNHSEIRKHALEMIQKLDIRCIGPEQITRRLSGGNQQKVCIARALTLDPMILLVSEPTRGIDIGAKKLVLDTLIKLNKELGITIIITSSELAELRSICHRIAIVSEGKIEGILKPDDSDTDYGLMMSGEYNKLKSKEVI